MRRNLEVYAPDYIAYRLAYQFICDHRSISGVVFLPTTLVELEIFVNSNLNFPFIDIEI
jgi:hypothetical protein